MSTVKIGVPASSILGLVPVLGLVPPLNAFMVIPANFLGSLLLQLCLCQMMGMHIGSAAYPSCGVLKFSIYAYYWHRKQSRLFFIGLSHFMATRSAPEPIFYIHYTPL